MKILMAVGVLVLIDLVIALGAGSTPAVVVAFQNVAGLFS